MYIMMSLTTPSKAQRKLAENVRLQRLDLDLTQEGLAIRAGVKLPTLRKFERTGMISLEAYLKLQLVLGRLDQIVTATRQNPAEFKSIDDVLKANPATNRQRGRRK